VDARRGRRRAKRHGPGVGVAEAGTDREHLSAGGDSEGHLGDTISSWWRRPHVPDAVATFRKAVETKPGRSRPEIAVGQPEKPARKGKGKFTLLPEDPEAPRRRSR
jgi:hypothetical protein